MQAHRDILKSDPNSKPERQDKHRATDEGLKPHKCPRFEPGEDPARMKADGGKFMLERRCQHPDAKCKLITGLRCRNRNFRPRPVSPEPVPETYFQTARSA
jgi:hypothetical protein